jgi:hypothetical protein
MNIFNLFKKIKSEDVIYLSDTLGSDELINNIRKEYDELVYLSRELNKLTLEYNVTDFIYDLRVLSIDEIVNQMKSNSRYITIFKEVGINKYGKFEFDNKYSPISKLWLFSWDNYNEHEYTVNNLIPFIDLSTNEYIYNTKLKDMNKAVNASRCMDEFVKLIEKSPRYMQVDYDEHDLKLRKYDNRYYLSLISKPFHV